MSNILRTRTDIIDMNDDEIKMIFEFYEVMKKYSVHRIYRVKNTDSEFIEANQSLEISVNFKSTLVTTIFSIIKYRMPKFYNKVILKRRMKKYRSKLKSLMEKNNIELLGSSGFSLNQGIYCSDKQICISGVDIIYKNGIVRHIDRMYIDI